MPKCFSHFHENQPSTNFLFLPSAFRYRGVQEARVHCVQMTALNDPKYDQGSPGGPSQQEPHRSAFKVSFLQKKPRVSPRTGLHLMYTQTRSPHRRCPLHSEFFGGARNYAGIMLLRRKSPQRQVKNGAKLHYSYRKNRIHRGNLGNIKIFRRFFGPPA